MVIIDPLATEHPILMKNLQLQLSLLLAIACVWATACATRGSGELASQGAMVREIVVSPPLALADESIAKGAAYELAGAYLLPHAAPEEAKGLHNVFQLGTHIISGSEPQGAAAFEELRAMGVLTVLSVDGKVPDVALAAQYGMTYVHVPLLYSGVKDDELLKVTKTFREKPGPFYVHCFHGVHRGPAAAGIGRLVLDGVPREEAVAEMRQWSGTSSKYEALYRVVAGAEIPTVEQTRALIWDFPSKHPVEGFRQGMVELTRVNDHLKVLARNEWKPSESHPDLDAINEATKLATALTACSQLDEVADELEDFKTWMTTVVDEANTTRDALKSGDYSKADAAFGGVQDACKACHAVYRN